MNRKKRHEDRARSGAPAGRRARSRSWRGPRRRTRARSVGPWARRSMPRDIRKASTMMMSITIQPVKSELEIGDVEVVTRSVWRIVARRRVAHDVRRRQLDVGRHGVGRELEGRRRVAGGRQWRNDERGCHLQGDDARRSPARSNAAAARRLRRPRRRPPRRRCRSQGPSASRMLRSGLRIRESRRCVGGSGGR